MNSVIFFSSIDFFRKQKRIKSRTPLIFDNAILEGQVSLGEALMIGMPAEEKEDIFEDCQSFLWSMNNEELFKAFSRLNLRQQKILIMSYGNGYLDKEIAKKFCVSQQAVAKLRLNALKKLKQMLLQKGNKIDEA